VGAVLVGLVPFFLAILYTRKNDKNDNNGSYLPR
jgi:hypothetical protein